MKVTVSPGFAALKSPAICVKAPFNEEAANTVRAPSPWSPVAEPPEPDFDEQAVTTMARQMTGAMRRFTDVPSSDG